MKERKACLNNHIILFQLPCNPLECKYYFPYFQFEKLCPRRFCDLANLIWLVNEWRLSSFHVTKEKQCYQRISIESGFPEYPTIYLYGKMTWCNINYLVFISVAQGVQLRELWTFWRPDISPLLMTSCSWRRKPKSPPCSIIWRNLEEWLLLFADCPAIVQILFLDPAN